MSEIIIGSNNPSIYSQQISHSRIDSTLESNLSNSRLRAILGDVIDINSEAHFIADAFSNLSEIDTILHRSEDSLTELVSDYNHRRDLILKACSTNETYKANEHKLLEALDSEFSERISSFADDCVGLINNVANKAASSDASLVAMGWISGYKGSEGLFLRDSEAHGIKTDIISFFTQALRDSKGNIPAENSQRSDYHGQYLTAADLTGSSFFRKLEVFASTVSSKQMQQDNLRINEANERKNRPRNDVLAAKYASSNWRWATRLDIKVWQHDYQIAAARLDDTSHLDGFSDALKRILGRFDASASVYNKFTGLDPDEGPSLGLQIEDAANTLGKTTLTQGADTFTKYVSRIDTIANSLSSIQKALLGVMYADAESIGNDKAFLKVDAFAKALVTHNFHGFKFGNIGLVKGVNLLNQLRWYLDDESSTGIPRLNFSNSLTLNEQMALITNKYLPWMVQSEPTKMKLVDSALRKLHNH